MLQSKTVFILGAGASCDYGMPSGQNLLYSIKDECRKVENRNYSHIENTSFNTGSFIPLRQLIESSNFNSIDALLAVHPEHSEVGKFMIATCLLPLEKPEPYYKVINRDHNWMLYLFEKMEEDATLSEFAENSVAFITLNYDRCFEFFLRRHLRERYKGDANEVEEVAKQIPVIHVHGQLGSLTEFPFGETNYKFGASHVERASKAIKIIYEADNESPEFTKACAALQSADRVGILGFGYHRVNMDRLRFEDVLPGKDVYATRKGMTDPELLDVKSRLGTPKKAKHVFLDSDCRQLLRNSELIY